METRRRKSSRMFARKWHKSPHNRFKVSCANYRLPLIFFYYNPYTYKQQRQQNCCRPRSHQKQIVTYRAGLRNENSTTNLVLFKSNEKLKLILFAALLSLLSASIFACSGAKAEQQVASATKPIAIAHSSTSQILNSTSLSNEQQKQTLSSHVDKSFTKQQQQQQTTTTAAVAVAGASELSQNDQIRRLSSLPTSSTLSPTKLEEEVELSRATTLRRRQRKPRIYKLSTNPLNGKLSLPLRIDISDGLLSRPQNKRPAGMVVSDASSNNPSATSSTQTAQIPFGTRAQKSGSIIGNGSTNETEACNSTTEQQEEGSIGTSSQTLRLTKAEKPIMIQVPPTLRAGSQIRPSESPAGEVEEFSSGSEIEGLEREQPTLIATPVSTLLDSHRSSSTQINQAADNVDGQISVDEPAFQTVSSLSSNSESNGRANSNSILSLIHEYDSKIVTNRTKAQLSCDSGEMVLRLNFSEPFKGIVYPDHNRLSPCRFFGDGHHNYELRLPLRGCGTRQAAPRVFVNDVIVRFHKALELEEDEVKTLICRYPPPLAPVQLENGGLTSANSSNSNQAYKNYGDRATNNRPITPDQASNSNFEQESQFEFIDSLNGRLGSSNINKKLPEPGTTGQIETLSENLVVAPPIGQQIHYGQQITPDLSSGSNSLFNDKLNKKISTNNNSKQRPGLFSEPTPSIDIFNQRNSIASPNGFNQNNFPETHNSIRSGSGSGSGNGQDNTNALSYFERLSSIELLFLISSLMFLVLLALGLIGSYYCFRRQVSQSKQNRASAILRRKHRYLSSFDHRHNHGATLISPPTILQPQSSHKSFNLNQHNTSQNLRYPNQASHSHSHHHSHHHPHHSHHSYNQNHYQLPQTHQHHNSTASSSPNSDLSGQNLLESKGGSQRFSVAGGQDNSGFIFNGSFAKPESHQYQASKYGRAANQQISSQANNYNHQYTSSSRSRQIPSNIIDPSVGGLIVKQPPVVGRRDINTQHYGYGCPLGQAKDTGVSGRQQRHLSPKTIVQYPGKESRRWPANFSYANQTCPHHDGPLLAVSPNNGRAHEPEYSNTTRSLRFKDPDGSKVSIGGSLIPTKYALINKTRAKLASEHKGRSQGGGRSSRYPDELNSQLSRAKSLSAVNKDEALSRWQQEKMAINGRIVPLGGTLSRNERSAGGGNNYQRRQIANASFGGSQSILSEEKAGFGDATYSNRVAGKGFLLRDAATDLTINSTDDESFAYEDESCEQNNNVSEVLMHDKPISNIVLKSIEDAYITKFTEIYEQEYMKRDSTRPLAFNEWRAMQPRGNIVGRDNNESESSESVGVSGGGGGKLVSAHTTSDEDDEEQRYQSTGATNLRSLTELDVNFAKSMPTLTATPFGSPLNTARSAERLIGIDDGLNVRDGGRKQRSSSVPEVGDGSHKTPMTAAAASATLITDGNLEREKQSGPESPDLILSPDYHYNRLEFEPPGEASKSSHNSVSYV